MCILSLALQAHDNIEFLCTHNRDEFLDRPCTSLGEATQAGARVWFAQDLREGGTWFGFNVETGVFAALTNIRDASLHAPVDVKSRGALVLAVVLGECAALKPDALAAVTRATAGPEPGSSADLCVPESVHVDLGADHAYGPFNMLVSHLFEAQPRTYFITNGPALGLASASVEQVSSADASATVAASAPSGAPRRPVTHVCVHVLPPGVHVFSNSTLNDASWAKVKWLRSEVQDSVTGLSVEPCSSTEAVEPSSDASCVCGSDCDRDVCERLLTRVLETLTPTLTHAVAVPDRPSASVTEREAWLRSHVFLRPPGHVRYGTRSVSVCVRMRTSAGIHVCLCHHDAQHTEDVLPRLPAAAAASSFQHHTASTSSSPSSAPTHTHTHTLTAGGATWKWLALKLA